MGATYPFATSSPNDKIIQFVYEDGTNNKDLNIVHHINLNANQDADLAKIYVFDRNKMTNQEFLDECAKYFVVPSNQTDLLVVFRYIFIDGDIDRMHVKTFPQGDPPYYFVPGKLKVIATAVGDAEQSKTGGEAL